ncbi:hypothetical protein DZG03_16130, partial [Clavibacter phaseoli]
MARMRSAGADVVSPYTGLVAYSHPMAFTPDAIPDALHSARTADTGFLTIAPLGLIQGQVAKVEVPTGDGTRR